MLQVAFIIDVSHFRVLFEQARERSTATNSSKSLNKKASRQTKRVTTTPHCRSKRATPKTQKNTKHAMPLLFNPKSFNSSSPPRADGAASRGSPRIFATQFQTLHSHRVASRTRCCGALWTTWSSSLCVQSTGCNCGYRRPLRRTELDRDSRSDPRVPTRRR